MKLIFIRHGDPDYVRDGLTEKGRVEAKALADMIERYNIDEVYQSPLGRAVETAEYSLKVLGKPVTTCDWLKEFPALVDPNKSAEVVKAYTKDYQKDPETGLYPKHIVWDMMPSYYGSHPELFDYEGWKKAEVLKDSDAVEVYDYVTSEFAKLLEKYGYVRDGYAYKVAEGNNKTIAFFCHYGITGVLLSYLWRVSPFVPLQYIAVAPTSVTVVASEEREKGIATFRTIRMGDISHLNIAGEEPSFSARFCEKFENEDERH